MKYEISPPKGLIQINLSELWRYRDLLFIFVWRDVKVRYKQTVLGIIWAIFQPLLVMVIFTVFFGQLAKIPSDGVPYPIFVYSGLLLWNYFSSALTNASDCLIVNESIIKKVYFPRLILPISTAITPIIDFFFALIVLLGLMWYYGFAPSLSSILILVLLLLISLLTALGLGLFLASVNAKYRDVRYILPFFIQVLMYITPVIYPVSIIPARFQWIMYLNPMAGVITAARATLLHTAALDGRSPIIALGISLLIFILGVGYFRKTERFFADVL
ncbi:MAG: ABC transporter permease [Patescibacteria group bacterium]|jgi:lipopolysaccharide transport system permease protein